MPATRREFLALAAGSIAVSGAPQSGDPPRLPRKDCFFGLHFDLHPNKTDTALGRDLTDAMVESLLERVRPDYVQYDSKGHAGYLGFPSQTGNSAPGIVKDSLEIWRRVTARRGVGLFIHFSGVWDSLAVEQHPDWARVRPDGKKEDRQTSTFGPYADRLMIPELEEAAAKYALDGAWVDGECWATNPDYSEAAARAFTARTGIRELPKSAKDRGWLEFLEVNREQFRSYVRHYVEQVHRSRPGFQIASNWLYSTYVPERPELPVDFLSGDYLGANCISTARLEARYLAAAGKAWDLMAWGFFNPQRGGHLHKPAVQLEQEAAVVLAQGGGFQIYYNPTRAGRIDDCNVEVAARVGRFCRARQALSHKSEAVPQLGIVFSKHSLYATSGKLFGGWGAWSDPARGLIDALAAAHHSIDVIPDWKFEAVAAEYPAIVVPDWLDLGDETEHAVRAYVEAGGSALICGAGNAGRFAAFAGCELDGAAAQQTVRIAGSETFGNIDGLWQDLRGGQAVEVRYSDIDTQGASKAAAVAATAGKGRVVLVPGPLGAVFAVSNSPALREFIARLAARLYEPMVRVEAPPVIECSVRRKGGRLLIHLVNLAGMADSPERSVVDYIPPVGPVRVNVRLDRRPSKVTWEPEGQPLTFQWSNNRVSVTIGRVDIHGIVSLS